MARPPCFLSSITTAGGNVNGQILSVFVTASGYKILTQGCIFCKNTQQNVEYLWKNGGTGTKLEK